MIHTPKIVTAPTGTPIPIAILSDVLNPLNDGFCAGLADKARAGEAMLVVVDSPVCEDVLIVADVLVFADVLVVADVPIFADALASKDDLVVDVLVVANGRCTCSR